MRKYKNMRNPILPLDIYIPDSEAHVMPDGNLYIYGSFDGREDVFCSHKYHVISTSNMSEWVIHDVSLKGEDIPWFNNPNYPHYPGIDWTRPTPFIKRMLESEEHKADKEKFETANNEDKPPLLFAPDAIHKNGKYYLYFCMSDDSEGVAISDSPTGPFKNPIQLPCGGIDPAVFTDDDGQSYLYWGQLFSHGVKLNHDMVSFHEENIVHDLVTEEEHFFHEGSSMRKIGDLYYYVYSNMERGKPTSLGYSIGRSPLGPFEYKGIIIDNDGCDPASWNNHGSIECFDGQWYVFYHRCTQGVQHHRRLCIEPITIHSDGTIDEVKMTSQGVGKPFQSGEKIMGYQACELEGEIYIGKDLSYGEKLMHIASGDKAYFRYVQKNQQWHSIELLVSGKGKINVLMNNDFAGTVTINSQSVERIQSSIIMEPGQYELVLQFIESAHLEIYEVTLI